MRIREFIELWKRSRLRLESADRYREFQSLQAELLIDYLSGHGVILAESLILDLGSGLGGYSKQFSKHNATVLALDRLARRMPLLSGRHVHCVEAEATKLPFPPNSIDFVFCASLIEHVSSPELLLQEMNDVLRPGGACYVSFPPFYSLRGGHECSPFHYLGVDIAMRIRRLRNVTPDWIQELYEYPRNPTSYADLYLDHGLNKLTVRGFLSHLANTEFTLQNQSTRFLPFSFIRWPLLGEVLTWHAQFLLKKPE